MAKAPNIAPIIEYFFACALTSAQAQNKIRYYLNWKTQNAIRVEIFGHAMEKPEDCSWPVYNESDDWVHWAAKDQVRIEQTLVVQSDSDTGNVL